MINHNWEKVFANLKTSEGSLLVKNLNQNGFILEEDTFITKVMLYEALQNLNKWFSKHGYLGGELFVIGDYFPKFGVAYIIFDNTRFDHKDALLKLTIIYT